MFQTIKTYHRTENQHPVLGVEYQPNESSSLSNISRRWDCCSLLLCRQQRSAVSFLFLWRLT
ncbi:DUF1852 family protein [Vibrio lentus]|nr:DUF1852 family protein [Vibrio lentus]